MFVGLIWYFENWRKEVVCKHESRQMIIDRTNMNCEGTLEAGHGVSDNSLFEEADRCDQAGLFHSIRREDLGSSLGIPNWGQEVHEAAGISTSSGFRSSKWGPPIAGGSCWVHNERRLRPAEFWASDLATTFRRSFVVRWQLGMEEAPSAGHRRGDGRRGGLLVMATSPSLITIFSIFLSILNLSFFPLSTDVSLLSSSSLFFHAVIINDPKVVEYLGFETMIYVKEWRDFAADLVMAWIRTYY